MSKISQKNFVFSVTDYSSPIIITVPHGGLSQAYASWLENFFQTRQTISSASPLKDLSASETICTGGDQNIWHIAADILKVYSANAIMGLLPRAYVDYNRFTPEIAYADQRLESYYTYYHERIGQLIQKLLLIHQKVILLDLHGFAKQPIEGRTFDLIIGTNNGETTPNKFDVQIYDRLKSEYQIFCAGCDGWPKESEAYKGDTTNLHYHRKYGVDSLLLEISPRFRNPTIENSREKGIKLAGDLARCFKELAERLGN